MVRAISSEQVALGIIHHSIAVTFIEIQNPIGMTVTLASAFASRQLST